ncbi:type II toxin-antitoxin system Phd/YefM family antitoxin [Nocardia arthritidis]|uniref:type II toxin-antitoxin system Phd/YefM family antitoxin n=1 Tax=Nocardia arthritidis TaxID=228602 RepID=UPI001EEA8804|nr:type II toxin-antitoxin system Phd/YefM family antitoxin [Nocardia arthritidis]
MVEWAVTMARKRNDSEQRVEIDIAWPLAEAKARFSELIDRVEREGPQVISKHGREVAVVVPVDEWRQKSAREGSFAEFLASSPLRGVDIEITRIELDPREVDFSDVEL